MIDIKYICNRKITITFSIMIFKKIFSILFISSMCVTASFADNEINPENKPAEEEMGEPMDWYDEESEFEALFSVTGDDILSSAMRYIGTPYRMGSTGPSSFDCSGFTSYVYRQMNINLNRTSRAQYTQGVAVSKDELRPGDLVFFGSPRSGAGVGHVGIVYEVEDDGDFKFVHASCKRGVTVSSINDGYYARKYRGARRILAF